MQEINNYEQIYNLIRNEKDVLKLSESLKLYHPYDIARVFLDLDIDDRKTLYKALSSEELADIFEYLDEADAAAFLKEMDIDSSSSILGEMETDDAADVINEMSDDASLYLNKLDVEDKKNLSYLTTHKDDTAGSIMTTNFLQIESDWDVKEAMKFLVTEANEAEIIDPLFVSKENKLVGIIELKDLIIARSPKKISEIMHENYVFINTTDSIIDASTKINNYDIYALPVLDGQKLVGIITMDDALDVIEDEATDDYEKMAILGEEVTGKHVIIKSLISRLPWLILLLILSLLISNVIGIYEDVIKQVTVLIFFQTLILDMAGNIGTQALAVTIRSLGRHELDTNKRIRKHFLKEFKISLFNSFLLGVLAFLVCFIFLKLRNTPDVDIMAVSFVVSLAMMIALILSGLLGTLMPTLFYKLKIDPAVASGPFITTLNDLISVVVYFNLAMIFLNIIE
ncbi:MAG: magnesium transporter [Bacilli bacterium]|nr:magnesium transporter [Bacilli bacterium]